MNCPNCGAAMRLDAEKECLSCDFCGTVHFPAPNADGVCVLGGASTLGCPVCKNALVQAAILARPVLYCERCRGMLIRMETFVVIVDLLRARQTVQSERTRPLDRSELRRSIHCPRCRKQMDTHPYAGPGRIVIDSCSACHLNWLDHSELRSIITAREGESEYDDLRPLPPPPSAFFSGSE